MDWSAIEDLQTILLKTYEGFGYRDPWFLREFVGLINHLKPTAIVETGTYKGGMIKFLSIVFKNLHIFSCDVIDVGKVKREFISSKNIYIEQCDSVSFLKKLDGMIGKFPFFFLDAHVTVETEQDVKNINPLPNEIDIITKLYPKAIICVHDFEVPNTPIFGHGSIDFVTGQKVLINWQSIEAKLHNTKFSSWLPFFPARSLQMGRLDWKGVFDLRGRLYLILNPTKEMLRDMAVLENFGVLWKFKENL